jgi:hypothetical protein
MKRTRFQRLNVDPATLWFARTENGWLCDRGGQGSRGTLLALPTRFLPEFGYARGLAFDSHKYSLHGFPKKII